MVFAMEKEMTTNCPDASGWTHSGLRKRIGCAGVAAREFAVAPAAALQLMSKSRNKKISVVICDGAALISRHAQYSPDYPYPAVGRSFSRLGL
jgi:hypothetical protein